MAVRNLVNTVFVCGLILPSCGPEPVSQSTARTAQYSIRECLAVYETDWPSDWNDQARLDRAKAVAAHVIETKAKTGPDIVYLSFFPGKWDRLTLQFTEDCGTRWRMAEKLLAGADGLSLRRGREGAGAGDVVLAPMHEEDITASHRIFSSELYADFETHPGPPGYNPGAGANANPLYSLSCRVSGRIEMKNPERAAQHSEILLSFWGMYTSLYQLHVLFAPAGQAVGDAPDWLSRIGNRDILFLPLTGCAAADLQIRDILDNFRTDGRVVDRLVAEDGLTGTYSPESYADFMESVKIEMK